MAISKSLGSTSPARYLTVALVPYGTDQIIRVRGRGIVGHARLLGGEVDARLDDPLLLGERPFDPPHAGGASHPRHRDVDPRQPLLAVCRLHARLRTLDSLMLYPPTPYVKYRCREELMAILTNRAGSGLH